MVVNLSDDELKVILDSLEIAVEKYSAERIACFKNDDEHNYLLCGEKRTSASILKQKLASGKTTYKYIKE